jgi:RNA polymerase sigma-70 factor (ECF subfamily)
MMHEEVMDALKALPEHFRTVVVLADIQEFSYKEIAEIEDCPIGTVMSRLHRGRKVLQRRLRNYAQETGILPPKKDEEPDESVPPAASLDEYRQKKATEGK